MIEKLRRITPVLDELLHSLELKKAYEDASAALEAGRLVRKLRIEAGLTQTALANQLQMSQARVSAIEAGRGRDGPSYGLMKKVVDVCNPKKIDIFGHEWTRISNSKKSTGIGTYT